MAKIVTERLKQNIEAYLTSPSVAQGIWEGRINLILSHQLKNKHAGKLFYLVSDDGGHFDNYAYGIIQIMPGEKIRKQDAIDLVSEHGLTEDKLNLKWPNKQILYAYKFKLLNVFPTPIKVQIDPKTNIIEKLGVEEFENKIVINENLFKDIVLSEDFIGYKDDSIIIKDDFDLNSIVEMKFKEKLPFSEYVNFVSGQFEKGIYRLKLERIENETANLIDFNLINVQKSSINDIAEKLEKGAKYVVEETINDKLIIVQKNQEEIKLLYSADPEFELSEDTKEELLLLYGGNYVVAAYGTNPLQVFDCLYFNDKDITDLKWFERKGKLNSMNFGNNIKLLDSTVVDDIDSVLVAIKLRSLNKSNVLVRKWDATYLNEENYIIEYESPVERVHDIYTTEEDSQILSCNNESYFKVWSSAMAYYLGFITTDGHVDYENGLVEIMLNESDKEILNGLARSLGGISPKPINNSIRLRWRSKAMLEDLKKIGATGKKETRTSYKFVPETYKWDFLRGMFDADGNIYNGRLQMDNSCGHILRWVFKQFKTVAGDDVHLYQYTKHWKSPHYKIVVLGEGAKKLHKKLYSRKPYLSRKGKFQ